MNITDKNKIPEQFFGFVESSPVSYLAVDSIKKLLLDDGFSELCECDRWTLSGGRKYFVTRSGSSVIAFILPENAPHAFSVIASHSDSPCLKIKPSPEIDAEGHYVKLNTEKYGGMISSTWFDRPLSAAGRLITDDGGIKTINVDLKQDVCIIPSLAIHLAPREQSRSINPQKELLPLLSGSGGSITALAAKAAGVSKDSVIGSDLFLYNRDRCIRWGSGGEFFSAPRIDDLECAFSSVTALLRSKDSGCVRMCCVFDSEEVGSGTRQGAKSTFLSDVISRLGDSLGLSSEDLKRCLASSFMLSADNGHAVHPNYPEASCPTNRPYLNGGVLIKYNASQKYTTDGISEGIFKKICRDFEIPYQTYVNRSDIPGGSTLGNLLLQQVSVNMIDIGAPQLAMHSAYETAGSGDLLSLISSMQAFFGTRITMLRDGEFKIEYA